MKRSIVLLLIVFFIVLNADRLSFIDSLNLHNNSDLMLISTKVKSDTLLLPMITSRINLKTPNDKLYKYLIILSQYRFKGAYYPVIAMLEHAIPENIKAASLSYLLNIHTKDSITYLKNYMLKQKELEPIHYFILAKLFNKYASFSTILDKILSDPYNKSEASILLIANYKPEIKKYIIEHIKNKKFSKEKVFYILYYMAPHLYKRDIGTIISDIKKDPKNALMPISVIAKTNYFGVKQLKKLTHSKNKNIKKIAQDKYNALINTLSVGWVKDKIQYYDVEQKEFQDVYKNVVKNGNFDYKTLVKYASINDIEALKKLEIVLSKDISNNTLKELELINDLILILKLAPYYNELMK